MATKIPRHELKGLSSIHSRIAYARKCIAYADRCDMEAHALKLPPAQMDLIHADSAAIRKTAKALLRILLLAEREKSK